MCYFFGNFEFGHLNQTFKENFLRIFIMIHELFVHSLEDFSKLFLSKIIYFLRNLTIVSIKIFLTSANKIRITMTNNFFCQVTFDITLLGKSIVFLVIQLLNFEAVYFLLILAVCLVDLTQYVCRLPSFLQFIKKWKWRILTFNDTKSSSKVYIDLFTIDLSRTTFDTFFLNSNLSYLHFTYVFEETSKNLS